MIGRLVGKVISIEDSTLTLDVSGVGYEVQIPAGTLGRLPSPDPTGPVTLCVHTHVREEALELFGFASSTERAVFRLLIATPNVGPKSALGILSSLPPPDLAAAVADRDLARLTSISGVGKKTAERLVLELREKLPRLGPLRTSGKAAAAPRDEGDSKRLLGALTNMGYRQAEAERAVVALGDRVGNESLSDLLKAALAHLS